MAIPLKVLRTNKGTLVYRLAPDRSSFEIHSLYIMEGYRNGGATFELLDLLAADITPETRTGYGIFKLSGLAEKTEYAGTLHYFFDRAENVMLPNFFVDEKGVHHDAIIVYWTYFKVLFLGEFEDKEGPDFQLSCNFWKSFFGHEKCEFSNINEEQLNRNHFVLVSIPSLLKNKQWIPEIDKLKEKYKVYGWSDEAVNLPGFEKIFVKKVAEVNTAYLKEIETDFWHK